MKRTKWISTTVLILSVIGARPASAHDEHAGPAGHSHRREAAKDAATAGPHGGGIVEAGDRLCEVLFEADGVRVFLYDGQGRSLPAAKVRGVVAMRVDGNPKVYRYDLYPESTKGAAPNCLYLPVNLSRIPDGGMTASVSLQGVPGGSPRKIAFEQPFHLKRDPVEQAIASQKICPVSGKKLGSMGRPIGATVNGREVFVCCAGCTNALNKDPQKYLARIPVPPVARASKADAEAIKHQKMCPVMDEPLGSMGVPWKVPVKGGTVFVCCKGCIKRVKDKPELYLSKSLGGRRPARGERR